ncbi:hypothetical protein BUZ15_00870 [Staphylococcus gallinarum]|uniref:transcriptional regulator AryK n=1 Tax=Staphylococcus gallinarum TaxID=1293 RepID=UPI000D1DA043|nr:helix-turn-helix domain-containing protein [Staphylococcus gallinarum]PTL11604.1 hypothetical protein BUZ15_00870 [Staphylococcus gallinarum]PTL12095.1 hypothetical protein BUZ09_02085 [Staphylococcus gallinarum]RIL35657.1 helix-turn-helix domain-containing protein [Staphylococcus gallinarum]RIO78663.1 helix-turn-helix domain-containing protein [Staphylococcus gallinarum]
MNSEYNITFNDTMHSTRRINKGMLIVLVLNGSLSVEQGYTSTIYPKGEIFIINHNETYQFKELADCYYISIHILQNYLQMTLSEDIGKYFILKGKKLQDTIYQQLGHTIAKIGTVFIRKGRFHQLYIAQQMIDLLFIIIRYIPTKEEPTTIVKNKDKRIAAVCDYIKHYYSEPITLNEVAEHFDVSVSYLSRKFKQQMGIGFTHYINQIRLEHAKDDLLHTQLTVTQIAFKNGFNSSNLLIKYFRQEMKQTPSEYRKQSHEARRNTTLEHIKEPHNYQKYLYYLSLFINQNMDNIVQSPEAQQVINVQLKSSNKVLTPIKQVVQIGTLDNLLVERYKQQLNEIERDMGVSHIIIKDPIFVGGLNQTYMDSDEQIPHVHPYMHIDESLNYLMMKGIALGIELVPPQSAFQFKQYFKELKQLIKHMCNVYTHQTALQLVIYIQSGDKQQFLDISKLFKAYFLEVKMILNIPVLDLAHLDQDIDCYLELIDGVAFSANQNDVIDLQSLESEQFNLAEKHIQQQIRQLKHYLQSRQRTLSFTLLNWNTLTGNTNLTNGEYFRAGIIFEQLLQINHEIDYIGYWLNFEIHQAFNSDARPSQVGGIELYHQFDAKRPAYFTSMFYKRLFKQIMYQCDYCLVVGDKAHFQLVLWDAEHYNPYFITKNGRQQLNHSEYQINIRDMDAGKYKVKHLTLDKNNGALYKIWQQYNTTHGMDQETIDYVNRITYPQLKVNEVEVLSFFTYHIKLTTNAIHIIEFKKYI